MDLRQSGRTTRLAMFYAMECLDHPNQEVKVMDHKHNGADLPTQHHLALSNKVSAILTVLNVNHYTSGTTVCALPIEKKNG